MRKSFDIVARALLGVAAGAAFLASTAKAADILPPDTTSKAQAVYLATNNLAANPSGTNRMILMIISDTNSCTACVSLEFGILPSKAVRDFLDESFVYWACGPEQNCREYTEYTGNGAVALPTCFIINPYSPRGVYQYSSTGADSADTYFAWLKASLLKATAPRVTSIKFTNPSTVEVSGASISTNVALRTIFYKLNDGAWASQLVPHGTFASAFTLPALTVNAGAQNKLYIYGRDTSGTYKTKTNIVNLVPTAQKVDPALSLAANGGSASTYGQSVTYVATLSGGNGTPTGTVQFQVNGQNSGPAVSLVNGQASFALPKLPKGTATIGVNYLGDGNYNSRQVSATQTINPASLTVVASGVSREYNGTPAASVNLALNGVASGDDVAVNFGAAAFTDKHAGNGKTIAISGLSLTGSSASNYQLDQTTIATVANITKRAVTVTAVADTKLEDGTTASTKAPVVQPGALVGGDTPNFTQAFIDTVPGVNKTIVPSGVVNDGNGGNNYAVNFVSVNTGVIEPKTVTTVTVQISPMNKLAVANESVTFTATLANATGGETFQWRKDGVAVSGATTKDITIQNVSYTNAGSYQLVVTSAGTPVTSEAASLWVAGNAKHYMGLPVYGPAGRPVYFQALENVQPGGPVWQTVTNSGVAGVSSQVVVSEEISTSPSTNRMFRLFIP